MTPAVDVVKDQGVPHTLHSYEHDADSHSYGLEAAQKLQLPTERVFKTLVVQLDNRELAVALVAVDRQLGMKSVARALGAKKAAMADAQAVQRSTGYVLGGVSPLGQKKALRTVIDIAAQGTDTIFVSAGRRGLELELYSQDLAALVAAQFAAIAQ